MKKLPLSRELLDYYRQRLEQTEAEKQEMIESLKMCDVKHSNMHQLQWVLSEREEEVLSLQRTTKDQELQIFEQQEQILELRTENHQLRVQEMEDRKRIQQLLSLTKPVTQEVTFMRDVRPTKLTAAMSGLHDDGGQSVEVVCPGSMGAARPPPPLSAARSPKQQQQQGGGGLPQPARAEGSPPVATRLLRTVYLPSEKTDSMLLTIDALRRELEEYKRVSDEKLAAVMEQREQAMSEGRVQSERLLSQSRELQERVATLSTLLRNNEKEYLLLRHNTSVHERLMKEDNEALKEQNEQLLQQFHSHREKAEADMQDHAEHLSRQTESYVKTFRAHAHDHMKEKDQLEQELLLEKKKYKKDKSKLEERVATMADKCKRLDKIRRLNEERVKWEAGQINPDGSQAGPGKGGTATRATLLYDRFGEGEAHAPHPPRRETGWGAGATTTPWPSCRRVACARAPKSPANCLLLRALCVGQASARSSRAPSRAVAARRISRCVVCCLPEPPRSARRNLGPLACCPRPSRHACHHTATTS